MLVPIWYLTLFAGTLGATEGSPAVLMLPIAVIPVSWLAFRYVRTHGKRKWFSDLAVAPVLVLANFAMVVVGAVAAQAWRNVCRGLPPFFASGDSGVRLLVIIAFVWIALFASVHFATKSKVVSTRLWIALVTPSLVLCPFQIAWAI